MIRYILIGLTLYTTAAQAQDPGLRHALDIAERNSFANRVAAAQTLEQSAARIQALRGILPTLRVEAGAVRTTDPIGAFGTMLRQRRISAADFDPSKLNYPAATANYGAALVVEQPLFNGDAYLGRSAAGHATTAAAAAAAWSADETRVNVIKAYYGAVLAREKVRTLETALQAGRAHVDQAEKMLKAGLVTRSDVLLASVKAGEVETQLIHARGEADIARRQLAVVMGVPADTTVQLPLLLPGYRTVRELLQTELQPAEERGDVVAAEQQLKAAGLDVRRTTSLYLPRVNGFARYDWNSPTNVFAGDNNWSIGVMATWTPFAGASEWAERRAASARRAAAQAGRDGARAQAALEVEAADNNVRVALAALDVAERSAAQAAEAHRIVAHKYDGGLGSVTELLDAAAVETQSQLGSAAARYQGIIAQAERLHAYGGDSRRIADMIEIEHQEASK